MNVDLVLGILIGLLFGTSLGLWSLNSYKKILVQKSKDGIAEYIDGNFYCIVDEKRFIESGMFLLRKESTC
jgi:predicted membrane-bound spermidine synthase